jgi:hypothetical protein
MPVLPRVTVSEAENFDDEGWVARAVSRSFRVGRSQARRRANKEFAAVHKVSCGRELFYDTRVPPSFNIRSFELLAKRRQLLLHFGDFLSQFCHVVFQDGNAAVAGRMIVGHSSRRNLGSRRIAGKQMHVA